ncbi:MAG: hypothetical protein ACRDDZ_00935 [Marinifilaceae bacterium]
MRKVLLTLMTAACLSLCGVDSFAQQPWFITDLGILPNNELVATCKGDNMIRLLGRDGKLLKTIQLNDVPTGIAVKGNTLYVTTFSKESAVQVVDAQTGTVSKTFSLPNVSGLTSPVLSDDGKTLYVCAKFTNKVYEIDTENGSIKRECAVLREPTTLLLSKDGKNIYVTNFLPAQRADIDHVASAVSVIDRESFKKTKDIRLENGSNALRGMCQSPDGKYLFISHNLGRFTVPTSQLQQGWMNTSALSVINTQTQEFEGAILVDEAERGAAGVWSVMCDDKNMYVSHSGVHEISVIDYPAMVKKYEAYKDKTALNYDLHFLYGIRKRVKMEGNGPRCMVVSGDEVIVPTYFSDHLNVYNIADGSVSNVELNPSRVENDAQQGERMFNDAMLCFQNWQSCNGCHPGDARTDGMNWDLMNDGVGNPKNCKSLLLSIETPPSMISGIRASANIANRAGFKHIQFHEISEEDALKIDAYVMSLKPVASPYLVNGELSEKAKKGRKVFQEHKCDACHSGPHFTNLQSYRIGENVEFEKGWDTPTLIEVWRTAPYLFDGRAATLQDVFEVYKHGIQKKISKADVEALVEYVNSL